MKITPMVSTVKSSTLTLTVPPVHRQGCPGDHGGLVTQQERDSVDHIGHFWNIHRVFQRQVILCVCVTQSIPPYLITCVPRGPPCPPVFLIFLSPILCVSLPLLSCNNNDRKNKNEKTRTRRTGRKTLKSAIPDFFSLLFDPLTVT